MLAPPEARCSPRSKRNARPTRSELLALFGARFSPHSERDARPARSEMLALFGARCSPHLKRIARLTRSETLASLGARCSPCSERVARPVLVAPAHSPEWHPYTRPSGTHTLARVVPAHSLERAAGRPSSE